MKTTKHMKAKQNAHGHLGALRGILINSLSHVFDDFRQVQLTESMDAVEREMMFVRWATPLIAP